MTMNFTTDYRLENFILQTQWADIPAPVQERLRGCMLDLLGALVAGSGSGQFAAGLALARRAFRSGDIAVIGGYLRFSGGLRCHGARLQRL